MRCNRFDERGLFTTGSFWVQSGPLLPRSLKLPSDSEVSLRDCAILDLGQSQTVMVCRSNENGPKIRPKLVERRGCSTRVLPCLRRSVARVTENAATMGVDMGRGIAVIDLVLHMYRRSPTRRKLAELWAKYTEDSADERKWKGFELVRVHHQTLTRMFCDDPDGEFLDIDDIRCVWEEFVDALRDSSAKAGDPRPKATSMSYADVEQPAMQRSPSFARLVENLSSEASGASTPGTPAIDLVSRHGMILGVGCSSRDNSARGGSEYFRRMQGDKGKLDAVALVEQLHKKGLTRIDSGKTLAFD
ncbi:hypothetical protein MICPUN_63386 [Micromonas commoda]|uniref:Uncharacterized protein n=1 Tax=Micromonas commoda (strain RCC299 / NOUM17 / CCMP2709) TaxID=296587 RepID=C1EFS5_MICCC|nr:hypothetical protein MICPUN_63386 [Micromonas commoda]ACO66904.1 hypothetical protein MICPUN_63386 [Micromonas commoda]|eukprot:XP_002505646.1 hypothetical protein MICPUN_63386 [Micromonas commoda]